MGVEAIGSVTSIDISGMDLETALMAVQSNRANLLEAQLKDQIAAVQAKNDQVGKMNTLMGLLNRASADGKAEKSTDSVKIDAALAAEIEVAAKAAGVTLPPELQGQKQWTVTLKDGTTHTVDEAGKNEAQHCKDVYWAFRSGDYSGNKAVKTIAEAPPKTPEPNKGKLDAYVQSLKSNIDSLSNTQQLDMLRLQSLSNKRNESFEIMSNFVKKLHDEKAGTIQKMG